MGADSAKGEDFKKTTQGNETVPSGGETPDRLAEPLGDEEPPVLPFPIVAIGCSAGGLEACMTFFATLPAEPGYAVVVIQHLPPDRESMVAEIIARRSAIPVEQVEDGGEIKANQGYVIRPGRTLVIENGRFKLTESTSKPSRGHPIDDFFRSLAEQQRERAIGVVMSGMGSNGSAGAQAIKAVGGVCIAQDPETAKYPSMPRSLIDLGLSDYVLRPEQIAEVLQQYVSHPYAKSRKGVLAPAKRDRQAFNEILGVLRSRARQEFGGYKKPTVLRRIQRRMGLHQVLELSDYAKLLRQNPTEAVALADDLVIHVTGFFRDAEGWEALRTRVIAPLVQEREQNATIRAWVTACSSGEEAYTLAMLLKEASEAAGKQLDIKIFATDLAERTLLQARMGVYPLGIEAEVRPDRLERFFDREESLYRVNKELRELVVFAPQNVLQDPPFSRLDICTCRNLLIYLEPEVQKKLLHMLHFGLREGGALFLGNSETVAGAEDLFEPLDKRWRIFRRVGGSRRLAVDLSMAMLAGEGDRPAGTPQGLGRSGVRASMAHMVQRALLERFSPPAVVIDRTHRVVYFHGDTAPFLVPPSGEPTRDLLAMAREPLRGAVRQALQQAMASASPATVNDGFVVDGETRSRVAVTVAPLDAKRTADQSLVSFERVPLAAPAAEVEDERGDGANEELSRELRRVRDELQGTIEELQTSNEELKASNEEVTSVNEELQSTNEELETSKEELQSFNEELTTVNAQLQAKMEELESTTNDLRSLLASADIAVIFLDTQFRIRRFTAAVRELMEIIPSDIGRPLSDLARKFTDPHLLQDAQSVLEKLVPVEREISAPGDKWYVRRVLPYRTADNRIDGVVITFMNVTRLHLAEIARRQSDEQYRMILEGVSEYAIFMLDASGRIATWNSAAERLLGFKEQEAVGQSGAIIFTPEDIAAGVPQRELATAEKTGSASDDRWHIRKDGRRFWANGVTTALRNQDGSLRGFVKLMRDNTERKRYEETLEDLRRSAEAANEAKDQFLATLSHELRTPLSVILMWSKLMGRPGASAETVGQAVEAIGRSADAQRRLIEDLLDTARISTGKLRLNLRPFEIGVSAQEWAASILPAAHAKRQTVEVDLASDLGTVMGDPDRVQQIAWNLMSNAVKFTPTGGRIGFSVRRNGEMVEMVVRDSGQGISKAFLPWLFQRFRQAESGVERPQGGLGLGLSICKQLAELHGGTISGESEGPGKGATFTVRLPLPPAAKKNHVARARAGNDLRGKRILLVEDDADTRAAVAALLAEAGVTVAAVGSAAEGLEVLRSSRPDVIVSDLGMARMGGGAFMRAVRQSEEAAKLKRVPALALSAFVREHDVAAAKAAGFDRHLAKPVDADMLLEVVGALLLETDGGAAEPNGDGPGSGGGRKAGGRNGSRER